MPGRKPYEAAHNFIASMQKAVSCVTESVLKPSKNGYALSEKPHMLTWETVLRRGNEQYESERTWVYTPTEREA